MSTQPLPASPEFTADLLALADHGVKTYRLTRTARQQIAAILRNEPLPNAGTGPASAKEWLATAEVAGLLGVSTARVTQLRAAKAIIGRGTGKATRYKRSEIEAYLDSRPTQTVKAAKAAKADTK